MTLPMPLSREDHRALREAVLLLREAEHRRQFPRTLHVGVPGGPTLTHACGAYEDSALVTDLVEAMLQTLPAAVSTPWTWLTRPGQLSLHDEDVRWAAPVERAYRERGGSPVFVVVTREGWRDPRTGAQQQWRRLRRTS